MAYSTQSVVSDGSLVLLDISIEYFDRSEIGVYFDSVPTDAWAWVGVSDTQITFAPAVPVGTTVLIVRKTDLSNLRHEFSLGAAFTAQYLDEDLRQVLHIAQEALEGNFGGDFYGDIDMHTYRVRGSGDPLLPQDLTTKHYVDTYYQVDKLASAVSAASAATSATNAAASQLAAAASADAADLSEANAAVSEANAGTSATLASDWAEKGDGLDVTTAGTRSAKHHANAASASASTATTQAGIATTQAGIATTQAGNAATSASNAATSASNAATSETNAAQSLNGIQNSKQTIWIPAGAMLANGGAVRTAFSYGSHAHSALELGDAATHYGTFNIRMPKGYDGGPIQYQVVWRSTNVGSGDVRFGFRGGALGDGNNLSTSYGSVVYVLDNSTANSVIRISEVSADVTIANIAGKVEPVLFLQLYRYGSDALDTLTQACQVMGVTLYYNTTTLNDA